MKKVIILSIILVFVLFFIFQFFINSEYFNIFLPENPPQNTLPACLGPNLKSDYDLAQNYIFENFDKLFVDFDSGKGLGSCGGLNTLSSIFFVNDLNHDFVGVIIVDKNLIKYSEIKSCSNNSDCEYSSLIKNCYNKNKYLDFLKNSNYHPNQSGLKFGVNSDMDCNCEKNKCLSEFVELNNIYKSKFVETTPCDNISYSKIIDNFYITPQGPKSFNIDGKIVTIKDIYFQESPTTRGIFVIIECDGKDNRLWLYENGDYYLARFNITWEPLTTQEEINCGWEKSGVNTIDFQIIEASFDFENKKWDYLKIGKIFSSEIYTPNTTN